MLRVYAYEFCLELALLPPHLKSLPTSRTLPKERYARLLYLPGTLDSIRTFHLQMGELHRAGHIILYFPTADAIQRFWEEYRRTFQVVEAGGAVVVDGEGSILFIWRRGRWDLPKGKGEAGESLPMTAQRELREETGLECGPPERYLLTTHHIYAEKGKYVLKDTHWYLFRCAAVRPPVAVQTDEGIDDYRWVPPAEVPFIYPQSYGTIRDLIEYALQGVLSTPSS